MSKSSIYFDSFIPGCCVSEVDYHCSYSNYLDNNPVTGDDQAKIVAFTSVAARSGQGISNLGGAGLDLVSRFFRSSFGMDR